MLLRYVLAREADDQAVLASRLGPLFLMDYPGRRRLQLVGRARTIDAAADPSLVERLSLPDLQKKVERLVVIDVLGFDWNCPAYITPRCTAAEIEQAMAARGSRSSSANARAASHRKHRTRGRGLSASRVECVADVGADVDVLWRRTE